MDRLSIATPGQQLHVNCGADRPVILDVTQTYRYLAARAQKVGVAIECKTAFVRILQEEDHYVRSLIRQNDADREVTSRYLIDASGYHRAVLSSLGVGKRSERIGVGVECEFENEGTDPAQAVLFVGDKYSPSGYGWIFPTNSNSVRVGIGVIRPDTKASPGDLLDAFIKSRYAGELGLRVGKLKEKHFGVIPSDGTASSFLHGRILAVGDSVGQALPLVGEGIRYCIEAGREAGNALAAALDNPNNAERSLRSYQDWWFGKYRRQFSLAQRANVKMGQFSDNSWRRTARLLDGLSGDEMAASLRMDLSPRLACKLALRGGTKGALFFLRRFLG